MKTALTIYNHNASSSDIVEETFDANIITKRLSEIGVRFEQWKADAPLSPSATNDDILTAYTSDIERLKIEGGYTSVDVVHLNSDNPNKVELREKFLSEHIHTEDEVRFFVRGGGAFYLHPTDDKVYTVICTAGDLISVPMNIKHWFDMGEHPHFTAIRLFERPDGWVAHYTGERFTQQYPAFISSSKTHEAA